MIAHRYTVLTLFCRSGCAPPDSSACTASVWPLELAHMRAVQPVWGTQWEQNSDNTCWWMWPIKGVHLPWGTCANILWSSNRYH